MDCSLCNESGGLLNKALRAGATCNGRLERPNSFVIPKCSAGCYMSIPVKPDAVSGHVEVDARGLACPLPILRLAQAARALQPGAQILLLATDPAAETDLEAWCVATGHQLLSTEQLDGALRARIRLAEPPAAR